MYWESLIEKRPNTIIGKGSASQSINKHLVFLEKMHEKIHGKDVVPAGKLAELPSSSEYYGSGENTRYVPSGKPKSIYSSEKCDGLYTAGVNTCSALIIVAKDPDGKVFSVTLAHIGVLSGRAAIKNLFVKVRKNAGQGAELESSVIGGKNTAPLVLGMAKEEGKVKLEFIDSDQSVGHSIVVDKSGTIYYGRRMDLDLFCVD